MGSTARARSDGSLTSLGLDPPQAPAAKPVEITKESKGNRTFMTSASQGRGNAAAQPRCAAPEHMQSPPRAASGYLGFDYMYGAMYFHTRIRQWADVRDSDRSGWSNHGSQEDQH